MANWQPGPNFHLLSVEEQEGLLRQQIDENCFIFDPSTSMDLGAEVLDFLDPVAEAQSMVAPEVITGLGRQETVGSDDGVASGDVESSGDDAVVLHEVISTRVREALQGGVKHAICRVVLTGSNDSITNGDVMAVAQSLKEKITELYLEHIVQGARPADEAQMVLWTSTMESPISTPYRPVNDVTAEHLMTAIAKSQNSGATISFNDQLVLEFILIRKDPSWRIDSLPEVNAGRGVLHLLYFGQESDKRSLKQIADVGDNACMAKCVVLGVVHTEYRLAKKAWGARLEQDYTLPAKSPEEVALFATYKQLGKKRKVNSFLDKQVQKLYADSGVTQGKLCNLEDLKKFEAVVDVCLKVVSLKHTLKFIYQGSLRGDRMIYLLYTEDPKSKVGHFGLITNIRGFFSRNFFCMVCDIGYDNIYDHRCPDIPNLCYTCFDRTCIPNPSFKQGCQWCHAKYRSSKCGGRHLLASCKEKWRCPRCHQKSRRAMIPDEVSRQNLRPKTNAEMEASHDCNNFFCKECKIERPDDHKCFIAKKKLEPKLYKFIFFDFETDQSSGEHLVNFIHMKYFVRDEEDEKKDEKSKKEALKAAQRGDEDVTWDDSHLCNHEHWKGKWLECSFAGSDSLTRFFRFLSSHQFKDYTAIAHNMSGYDGIFLLRELVTNGVMPDVIVKGQRVLMMKIPRLNIRIIDSFNFLPMGLAKLPEAFGLECGEKGYFPHFYNRPQNAAYEGPLPEAKYYGVDLMGVGEKVKFEEWHSQQTSAEVVFNFQAEMKKYCRQDVNILTDSCLAYRKLMCLETDCDPFAYLTCASVCAAVYNANHMPPGSIAWVPPAGYNNSRYSNEACEWLEHLKWFGGITDMRHAGNTTEGEKKALGPRKYAFDGYSEETNTVYDYYGCFWHGCRKCFSEDKTLRNPDTQKLLTVSFKETMKREDELRALGYNVKTIWACEWKAMKDGNTDVKEEVVSLGWDTPLNPRDAFFGGRTECFKLTSSDIALGYEDVTSLYPFVNFWMLYPIGHPKIITHGFGSIDEYFGLVKCTVLPPQDLYVPVLPKHTGPTNKLIFPLCRTCADKFQTSPCNHKEGERALQGTWFTEELKLALEKGYRLLEIKSVWHFENTSSQLFRDYVKTFYKKKLVSSKVPFETEGEVRDYMAQVFDREQILIEDPSEFKPNPGLRQLTKLMLNNLWGRYGMRQNLSKSVFISDVGPLVKLLVDPLVEVQGVRVITDDCVQVIHRSKQTDYLATPKNTNIFVAVATTAWARVKLYREMDKLQERVYYCDTDSVIYKRSSDPLQNLTTGPFLGDMTDELSAGDLIVDYVSGGPKNYGYRTAKGKVVVKVKGFTLNCTNTPAFAFDNIRQVILSGVVLHGDGESAGDDSVDVHEGIVGSSGLAVPEEEEIVPSSFALKRSEGVGRVPLQCPKRRKLNIEKARKVLLADHLQSNAWQSALVTPTCISVYNAQRIQRTCQWQVLQTPEQKLYSFCFDKRIILSNYDTIPYGYVGPLG